MAVLEVPHDDVFLSRGFSDIVRVIDGRATIVTEAAESDIELRAFLKEPFGAALESDYLEEAFQQHVEAGREGLVLKRIRDLVGGIVA